MKTFNRVRCVFTLGIVLGVLAMHAPAGAQFPGKPVLMVVPVGPGGVLVITFANRCFPTKAVAPWG